MKQNDGFYGSDSVNFHQFKALSLHSKLKLIVFIKTIIFNQNKQIS